MYNISAHPSFFVKHLLFQMGGDSAVEKMTVRFDMSCFFSYPPEAQEETPWRMGP